MSVHGVDTSGARKGPQIFCGRLAFIAKEVPAKIRQDQTGIPVLQAFLISVLEDLQCLHNPIFLRRFNVWRER